MLQKALRTIAEKHGWRLEAWAILQNHDHFIADAPKDASSLVAMLRELHSRTAVALNRIDESPGRKVWHNDWETLLTEERAYLARLHDVHQNPVKHGLIANATDYPWCSAREFEALKTQARVRTICSFAIDRLSVNDDY